MDAPTFFQSKYAWANNWGRVVGFDANNILVLERETEDWETRSISCAEIRGIRVQQYRSIYALLLAVGAATGALIVGYIGIIGAAIGPGIFTIPLFLSVFSYVTFTDSKRIRIDFDTITKRLVYKSWPGSFQETLAVIPNLQHWADEHRIEMAVGFSLPLKNET